MKIKVEEYIEEYLQNLGQWKDLKQQVGNLEKKKNSYI